jgi:hypothetical protein
MTDTPTIETVAWMKQVSVDINNIMPGAKYYTVGHVVDCGNDHTLAVAESGTGAGRFYCQIHKAIFLPTHQCPVCAGVQDANSKPEPVSRPLTLSQSDENSGDDHDNPQG